MSEPHHDSAAFLSVVYEPESIYRRGVGEQRRAIVSPAAWYVRRTCECHAGEDVSVPFETRAEAERCLTALDDDCQRRNG